MAIIKLSGNLGVLSLVMFFTSHVYAGKNDHHHNHCIEHCDFGTCVGNTDHHGHTNYQCIAVQPTPVFVTTTKTTTTTRTTTPTATVINTPKPVTLMTTLPPVSATSAKTSATSAALPRCDHSAVLTAITFKTQVVNQAATVCSTGTHTSHDALILTNCAVPKDPSSWQQGVNVMANCGGSVSSPLPTYSPIAAFDNGIYSSMGSLSGVFLGCTNTGFKIAMQSCGHPPFITEIAIGGNNAINPNTYYTIS